MARAKSKKQLLEDNRREFDQLLSISKKVPDDLRSWAGACEQWSVKDLLAHLHAWHMLFLAWYQEGMSGGNPAMPAPGFTWKQTPELNELIFQEYQDEPFQKTLIALKESQEEVTAVIQRHTNEELFTKKLYPWTGSTSLGSYLISTTASHYSWASKLIRKWLREQQEQT